MKGQFDVVDNRSTLGAPEGRTDASASAVKYSPDSLIGHTIEWLGAAGIPVDIEAGDTDKTFLAASVFLLALGVEPAIDPADSRPVADRVLTIMFEDKVKTTTRSRRSL
jgi:hypothetical protein